MSLSPWKGLIFLSLLFVFFLLPASSLDFLFESFNASSSSSLLLINDARIEPPVVRLTNDSNQFSYGRTFYSTKIQMINTNSSSSSNYSSFSTSFVFSILPEISTSPGFGLVFTLSNSTSPPGALAGQYLGLFSNVSIPPVYPLLGVEFDVGRNPEFNDPDSNHVGIDLNNIESVVTQTAGYYNSSGDFVSLQMRTGQNIRAWIEFDGINFQMNVTIAPVGMSKPTRPLLNYTNSDMANYLSSEMYVGFSASKTTWVEAQRILAWSFSDNGVARDINVTGLPLFMASSSASSLSNVAIVGIAIASFVFVAICLFVGYLLWMKKYSKDKDDEVEDWELEFWPHRFSFEELSKATNSFSNDQLLGSGGFGKVFRGTLPNDTEVAVKCVNHDSKQGLREFMAEIGSMGRLQHKNLVQMRGWCRKGNELMLVYDYMPNGSLNRWIFDKPVEVLSWSGRRKVLADVAEGLNYLHTGWDQVVIHRDIKSSNVLMGADMRGRLGDFGLAKLYQHGSVPNTTRVVGTLGYLAPELANVASPTTASDVYSFGVVVLEVACGRRPIEMAASEEEQVLIDWVRDLYAAGRLSDAADKKVQGQYRVEEMEIILKLGLACCHPNPTKRPTMSEVVAVLIGEASAAPAEVLRGLSFRGIDDGDSNNDYVDETSLLTQSKSELPV